jgi:hypothetical protein
MLGWKRKTEEERWYLLPAMQHGARKKFIQRLLVAILVGSLTAAALGAFIYYNHRL